MSDSRIVFIAGALSNAVGVVRLETLYEKLGTACEKKGLKAFIPHRDAGPKVIRGITPETIYSINMQKIEESSLFIAYIGQPSVGVGMEIQQACVQNIDVIVLSETSQQTSKFLQGCPKIFKHIRFVNFDDAEKQLNETLEEWLKKRPTQQTCQ